MTDKRYFIRLVSMLDFQLSATQMKMHDPNPEACAEKSDQRWVKEHETWVFPVMEKAPISFRYIAQRIAQVKVIPHHDVWIVWSRAPALWHDSANLVYGDPVNEHKLLHEWGNFSLRRRHLMRTAEAVREVWPEWLKTQEWFTGQPDPTCLT
jgi:hypothetical protein